MSDHYYRFFPCDYHGDTGDLTMLEHGAYRLLLDHYYMQGRLPADRKKLYHLCRAFDPSEQEAINLVVDRFFVQKGYGLFNRKAEEELERRRAYLEDQARKSQLGVESRRSKKNKPTGQPPDKPTGQPEGEPHNMGEPLPSPSLKDKDIKQRASTVPDPVDNSNGMKKELLRKIIEEFSPRQAREVTLFLETNRRKHPEALIHCLNRLIEEKARGSPPTAIGSWLEAVMREENKNYNARDSEAECEEHKRQPGLTSIGDIFKGVPGGKGE